MRKSLASGAVLAMLVNGAMASAAERDRDGDGVSDTLEQALIERFRPQFHVSARECAELPAEFEAFSIQPRVRDRNATLYARVSPSNALGPDVATLELHYYHLWDRDCGRLSPHKLDVEHVSTLVVAATPEARANDWTARYWYAAAHEDTVCDTSSAARANVIGAVTAGPSVWISAGKHASYLSRELCGQRGCGVDDCREMVPLPVAPVINVGEAGAPVDGAVWIASPEWPLAEKLGSDFEAELVTRLEEGGETVLARVNGQWRPTQFSLSIGSDVLGALGHAGKHGGGGVAEAEQQTQNALGKAFRTVARALGKAFRAVGPALGRVVGMGATKDEAP